MVLDVCSDDYLQKKTEDQQQEGRSFSFFSCVREDLFRA